MCKSSKIIGMLGGVLLALLAVAPAHADDVANLQAAVALARAQAPIQRLPRGDFLVRSTVDSVVLSPDGRHVAWVDEHQGQRSVWLSDTIGGPRRRVLARTEAQRLHWSHDSRWLFLETPRQIFALVVAGQTGSGIVTTLGGREQRELVAIDPVSAAAVIVVEHAGATSRTSERWRLLRIDSSGKRIVLREDGRQITGFAFDRDGRLAFLQRVEGEALVIQRIDAMGRLHSFARCGQLNNCSLLPVTDANGRLLLRASLGGDLTRLLRLDADAAIQTLHVDPRGEADLDALVMDPVSGQPLIASYRSTIAASYGLDADSKRQLAAIVERFPQRDIDVSVGRGANARWLIGERGDTLQGTRWHLYDPGNGRFNDILDDAPVAARNNKPARWLPEASLARKITIAWRASDGMRLHGFLVLPAGVDPATLPLVVAVHGGPWSHVRPGYGSDGQLLANHGYAVFQPNFRGSTGYGRDYMLAAHGDFGNGRVQQDIVDGVRYLLAQGIGDPQRVAIAGGSFGGYSALLGVTFAPELFKVGVAVVPPADFSWTLRWFSRGSAADAMSRYVPFASLMRMLSLDIDDPATMARLHAQSPLANVDRLRRPLVLIAGGKDRRVALRGVIEYAARLKLLDKDVSLLVDADAGHANDDPLAKEAYLYVLERMLHRHVRGAAPQSPDAALRNYLQRTLRLAGPDLQGLAATRD